jgi:hypothetical protein
MASLHGSRIHPPHWRSALKVPEVVRGVVGYEPKLKRRKTMAQGHPGVAKGASRSPDAVDEAGGPFWAPLTIEQLAAQQSVAVPQPAGELLGQAADLWESEEDFDHFVMGIEERRRPGEGAPKAAE